MRKPPSLLLVLLLPLPLLSLSLYPLSQRVPSYSHRCNGLYKTEIYGTPSGILRSSALLASDDDDDEYDGVAAAPTRRQYLVYAAGTALAIPYFRLVGSVVKKLTRDGYPEDHVARVRRTFAAAAEAAPLDQDAPVRVLEIGVGSDLTSIFRGYYGDVRGRTVRITGVDPGLPPEGGPEADALLRRGRDALGPGTAVELERLVRGDARSVLAEVPDGSFDAVLCALCLCSVLDGALRGVIAEVRQLCRPDRGTFGFVEHVAVPAEDAAAEDGRKLLAAGQVALDPLQQALAHGCHLHRDTGRLVREAFSVETGGARVIQSEQFYVDEMWPVSCQERGVRQRISTPFG